VQVEDRTAGPLRIGRGEPQYGGGDLLGRATPPERTLRSDFVTARRPELVDRHVGLHKTGRDRADRNAAWSQRHSERLAQCVEPRLARTVRGLLWPAPERISGRDGDDAP